MSDGNIDNTGGNLLSPLEFAPARHNLITDAAFELLDPEAKARVEELLAAGSTSVEDWGAWGMRSKAVDRMIRKQSISKGTMLTMPTKRGIT